MKNPHEDKIIQLLATQIFDDVCENFNEARARAERVLDTLDHVDFEIRPKEKPKALNDITLYMRGRNGMPVNGLTFSGGEEHVTLDHLPFPEHLTVVARLQSSASIIRLVLLEEILRRTHKGDRTLVIPYFPYARQDRVTQPSGAFSLKMFAMIVNSLNYSRVKVFDPHSDVTPALVRGIEVIEQMDFLTKGILLDITRGADMIIAPDAGAVKKSTKIAVEIGLPLMMATKVREAETGKILRTEILGDHDLTGATVVIFDDICDGGRTFIELGKVLKARGAKEVRLFVTHGIFAQGTDELRKVIDKIYTTDTFIPNVPYQAITYPIVGGNL